MKTASAANREQHDCDKRHQQKQLIARRCQLWAECTIAVRTANNSQALMSSMAAQEMAVVPRSVPSRLRSFKIRASTGKAVTLIAVPMKRAKEENGTWLPANCG